MTIDDHTASQYPNAKKIEHWTQRLHQYQVVRCFGTPKFWLKLLAFTAGGIFTLWILPFGIIGVARGGIQDIVSLMIFLAAMGIPWLVGMVVGWGAALLCRIQFSTDHLHFWNFLKF